MPEAFGFEPRDKERVSLGFAGPRGERSGRVHARSAANPLGETPGWGMSAAPRREYIAVHEKRAMQGKNEGGSPGRFAAGGERPAGRDEEGGQMTGRRIEPGHRPGARVWKS